VVQEYFMAPVIDQGSSSSSLSNRKTSYFQQRFGVSLQEMSTNDKSIGTNPMQDSVST
jgi:hypothetical protein